LLILTGNSRSLTSYRSGITTDHQLAKQGEANVTTKSVNNIKGSNSDCMLKPIRVFPDPFRKLPNILVLCEVYNHDWTPTGTNFRYSCVKTMEKTASSKPWFGLEQEYTLLDESGKD